MIIEASILALLKAVGVKAALAKAAVVAAHTIKATVGVIHGFSIAAKGKAILTIAKGAIGVAQQYGWMAAGKLAAKMLIIISSVATGTKAIDYALKYFEALKNSLKESMISKFFSMLFHYLSP